MPRSLARIAAFCLAAILTAAFVCAGELAKPVPENAQVTRFTRFNIRYRLRDIVREGVQKVDFYMTKDMGATWEYYGEDFDKTSPMTVEVPGEGVYGFVCVVTDRNGNREREPKPGTPPETVIVVDRTPPTAKWLAPTQDILGRGSHIELEWEASDDYFGSNPVKIQYSADAKSNHDKNAKWLIVQENLPVKGTTRWTPPDSKKYHFRLIAEDRAGNAAVAYCAASVKVDNTPPYIVSVKPLRSNKLENEIAVEAKDEDEGSGVKEYSLYVSENMSATWILVKETGVGGESVPVKRRNGDTVAWKAPKSGEYPVWPVVFDNAGNATPLPTVGVAGPYMLVIDNEPPNVNLSNSFLMDGASILSNQSRRVEWTSYDPHMRDGTTKILLSLDNGKNWQELAARLPANGYEHINFPFGAHGRECKLKVTVEDDFGNVGEAVSETFRLTGAETTVDSVTPRKPTTDAAEDIFGAGGASSPQSSSGGGWFGLGGGSDRDSGLGSLPSLPGFGGAVGSADDDIPSLPPLPPRNADSGSGQRPSVPSFPSGGGLPSLPGFGGGDSYGGSQQDIYGGGADSYGSEPQASVGDWRRESAAGPLPSAIVGDALEPDPDSPEYRQSASASRLPGGLGGMPPPPGTLPGLAAAGGASRDDDDWKPSPRGGTTSTLASSSESSSYLSGDTMPWETGSSSSAVPGGLPPGLLAGGMPPPPGGSAVPPPPGGGSILPPPPGGGGIPLPPGGGLGGGAYAPQGEQVSSSSDWSSGEVAASGEIPGSELASSSSDWSGGAGAGSSLPAPPVSTPSSSTEMTLSLPLGSLRPPSGGGQSEPGATAEVSVAGGLPLPPLGDGGMGQGGSEAAVPGDDSFSFGQDFPAGLPGLDQVASGGSDDFTDGLEGMGLPGLPGFGDGFEGFGDDLAFATGSGSDGLGGDDFTREGWVDSGAMTEATDPAVVERDRDKPLPWPALSSDLPPEAPAGPPPGIPGLEQVPAVSGGAVPAPLQTAPGQRPANRRQESDRLIGESRALREEGRTDLAVSPATKAVEADPSNAEAYMELSQVNARMTPPDHVKAANLAKEATALKADWETWWNCADVFYIWAHACNREVQALSRGGQSAPVHLVDERNSTLSNALIAINNAASVMPGGDRVAAKKVGVTQGMITYLRALTVPEPANPGAASGPALDDYRRQQMQYKTAATPLLQEAIPYFKNVLDMGGIPGYQETFQLGIIYFRLAGLERDTGNPQQASANYQDAVGYLEQATTASDTPKEGPREAYYMLALSHDQLAEQPGANRARHKELALRYWRQTADFYDAGSAYRTYAEQRIDVLGKEMGL